MQTSIMSFQERGPWGNNKYIGNCAGGTYIEPIKQYMGGDNPSGIFVDACMGGGTSRDVCADLFPNIQYLGLDLREGFDFTKDSIREAVINAYGRVADFVFTHPPYHNILQYSGRMWGEANPRDTSRCLSFQDFLERSKFMLLNQRDATKVGGYYATLVGDIRQKGEYFSPQAHFITMMPGAELRAVLIKTQHNCVSDSKNYGRMKHPRIMHEYMMIWERLATSFFQIQWEKAKEYQRAITGTWATIVRFCVMKLGGAATLDLIYEEVAKVAGDKLATNPTWKATVRRTLQQAQDFVNTERGSWEVAA